MNRMYTDKLLKCLLLLSMKFVTNTNKTSNPCELLTSHFRVSRGSQSMFELHYSGACFTSYQSRMPSVYKLSRKSVLLTNTHTQRHLAQNPVMSLTDSPSYYRA